MVIGKSYQINCTVQDGQPEPEITWSFADEMVKHKNNLFRQTTLHLDQGVATGLHSRPVYISQLDFSPTIDFFNQTLVCTVEHPLLKEVQYRHVRLHLECKRRCGQCCSRLGLTLIFPWQ